MNDQYTYYIVIPLENEKHVSLKFIRSLNDTWVCTMSDECKRDLEKILPKIKTENEQKISEYL
jgi:hypothetical protein